MRNILKASLIYRIIAAIYAWFGRQWTNSRFVRLFLSGSGEAPATESSIFSKAWDKLHKGIHFIFKKLRLTTLLDGSIFKYSYIWCVLTVTLAPVLPTMAVLAMAMIGVVSQFLEFACSEERNRFTSPINKYVLILAFVYMISTCTSVTFRGSLQGGVLTVFFILFVFVVENSVHTRVKLDRLLYCMIGAGVLVSLYGLMQYFLGAEILGAWVDKDMFEDIETRVYSTLQNPNVLSEYLLLIIPITFAVSISGKTIGKKLFGFACTAVMILCMLLTYSRGGWLGLIVAAALFLVILDRRFILVGIVGLVALYFVLPDSIVARFTSIGNMSDTSTSYRFSIWVGTIAMLKDYWMCGIGPGTAAFNQVYPLYSYNAATAQHSHNLFLQITCDTGVAGIIIFLMLVLSVVRLLSSAISREKDKTSKNLQIGVLCAIAGFMVQSITDNSFYNYRVMLVFWVVVAIGALVSRRSSLPEREEILYD